MIVKHFIDLESFWVKQFVSSAWRFNFLRNTTELKLLQLSRMKFNSKRDSSHFKRWERIFQNFSAKVCLFRICLGFRQQTVFQTIAWKMRIFCSPAQCVCRVKTNISLYGWRWRGKIPSDGSGAMWKWNKVKNHHCYALFAYAWNNNSAMRQAREIKWKENIKTVFLAAEEYQGIRNIGLQYIIENSN